MWAVCALVFLLLCFMHKIIPIVMPAITAIPPTTPPTIGPIGVELFFWGEGVGVGLMIVGMGAGIVICGGDVVATGLVLGTIVEDAGAPPGVVNTRPTCPS